VVDVSAYSRVERVAQLGLDECLTRDVPHIAAPQDTQPEERKDVKVFTVVRLRESMKGN
jgi:hypothetical protein